MTRVVNGIVNPHSHLRGPKEEEEGVMRDAIMYAIYGGASVLLPMPNTDPWLSTAPLVIAYIAKAQRMIPTGAEMSFIPTGVISEETTIEMVEEMAKAGIQDVKVYPEERTTNSEEGVRDYWKLLPVVKRCGELGIRVHLHPEHPWMEFGNRIAEFAFLPIADMFLRATDAIIIWEHGTDARCIPFWKEMAKTGRFFVTLTAHHLATNEDLSYGDVRAVCKPSIKTEADRIGLVDLVMEDHSWVMAGADDAPHPMGKKHVHYGKCACGDYTAPFLLSLYAHVLDRLLRREGGIEVFKRFITENALALYKLPRPVTRFEIEDVESQIPQVYTLGPWQVEPFWATQMLKWSHRIVAKV